MKIATKTRYAMRVMIDLAGHSSEGCIPLKDVADRQNISKKYLEQVVSPLVAHNLLTVTRGHRGGYKLTREPKDITCAQIVSATENGLELLDCLSGEITCEREKICISQDLWSGLERAMTDYLESITLQDILDKEEETGLKLQKRLLGEDGDN